MRRRRGGNATLRISTTNQEKLGARSSGESSRQGASE
jgi:hypothetical protein